MVLDYKEISTDIVEGERDDDDEDETYWRNEKKEKSYTDFLRFRKAEVLIDGKLKSIRN